MAARQPETEQSDKSITDIDMGKGGWENIFNFFHVCCSVPNVKVTPHASERRDQEAGANGRRGQESMSP